MAPIQCASCTVIADSRGLSPTPQPTVRKAAYHVVGPHKMKARKLVKERTQRRNKKITAPSAASWQSCHCRPSDLLIGWFNAWKNEWLFYCLTDCMWLSGCVFLCLIGWPNDWLESGAVYEYVMTLHYIWCCIVQCSTNPARDFRLPVQCKLDLRPAGFLPRVYW